MSIITRLQPKGPEKGLQAGDVGGQLLRAHRSILDARDWLGVASPSGQQRKPGFAQGPYQVCFRIGFQNGMTQTQVALREGL